MPINYYSYLNIPETSTAEVVHAARKQLLSEFEISDWKHFIDQTDATYQCYTSVLTILEEINAVLLQSAERKIWYDEGILNTSSTGPEFDALKKARHLMERQRHYKVNFAAREIEDLKSQNQYKAATIDILAAEISRLRESLSEVYAQNDELQTKNDLYTLQTEQLEKQKHYIDDLIVENKEANKKLKSAREFTSLLKTSLFQPQPHTQLLLRFGKAYRGTDFPQITKVIKVISEVCTSTFSKKPEKEFNEIIFEFKNEAQKEIFLHRFRTMRVIALAERPADCPTVACGVNFNDTSNTCITAVFHPTSIFGDLEHCFDRTERLQHDQGNYLMPLLREIFDLDYVPTKFINANDSTENKLPTLSPPINPKTLPNATKNEATLDDVLTLITTFAKSANPDVRNYASCIEKFYALKPDEINTEAVVGCRS